tara:strand:+ start:654 stop:1310 length:657 start_codon:yes stop_codon:yes gene_type:complete
LNFLIPNRQHLELAKYFALIFMFIDHVGYLFFPEQVWMFNIGRIAMPLFLILFGIGLSTVLSGPPERLDAIIKKTLFFGVIAQPAYYLCFGDKNPWFTLNAMFVFCFIALALKYRNKPITMMVIVLIGGAIAEFSWFGLLLGLASYYTFTERTAKQLALLSSALLLFCASQSDMYGLLSVLVVIVSQFLACTLPRYKSVFYIFYPAHLYALALLAIFV